MSECDETFVILVHTERKRGRYVAKQGFSPTLAGARFFTSMQEVSKEAVRLRKGSDEVYTVWVPTIRHFVPWSEVLAAAEGAAMSEPARRMMPSEVWVVLAIWGSLVLALLSRMPTELRAGHYWTACLGVIVAVLWSIRLDRRKGT